MRRTLLLLLLVTLLGFHMTAQVQFGTESFVELLEGQKLDKPIFIDVYTTWCGPCKQMDKTTFQDEALGAFLNENFISVKWDADDIKYKADARRLGVDAYPTFLFLDKTGKPIASPAGYRDAKNFMSLAQSILGFIADNPLKSQDISSLSLEDSDEILERLTEFDIDDKSLLVDHMVSQLGGNDSLWSAYAEVIAINSHDEMDLYIIQKLIDAQEVPSKFDLAAIQTNGKVHNALSAVLRQKFRSTKESADYLQYSRISQMRVALDSWLSHNQISETDMTKQLQTDRLDYYEYHHQAEYYKPLADSMIAQYILPHSPEFIRDIDSQDAERMNKLRSSFNEDYAETVDSTSLSFFEDHHSNGILLADRLDEVAKNILKIYDDTASYNDALQYAILAYDYVPLPKYLVTKAQIQYELGDKDKAIATLQEGKAHKFFVSAQTKINTMLDKLGGKE